MKHAVNFLWGVFTVVLSIATMSALYGWFAVPFGAPEITGLQLYGLSLLLATPFVGLNVAMAAVLNEAQGLFVKICIPIMLLAYLGIGCFVSWLAA